MHRSRLLMIALVAILGLVSTPVHATSMLPQNAVDLIGLSKDIVAGEILSVTDGIDSRGVPYTEVTLRIDEALKGGLSGVYSYRQFGLIEPRLMPNGMTNVNVTPDGWPRYRAGEDVLLFLYKEASITGLRTTVGLMQGKFVRGDLGYVNDIQNLGLFDGVQVDTGLLSVPEAKVVGTRKGAVPADAFRSLVKKTVRERWIETGRVADAR